MTELKTELKSEIRYKAGSHTQFCDEAVREHGAYVAGATEYALKWQQAEEENTRLLKVINNSLATSEAAIEKLGKAEEMMEKMAKAQRLIEQMSDPGDCYLAIYRMKSIASDSLTEYNNYKQIKDEVKERG